MLKLSNTLFYEKNIKILMLMIGVMSFPIYIIFMTSVDEFNTNNLASIIQILSTFGVLLLFLQLYSYKVVNGKYLDLYTVFLIFFSLFNFGQCLLWGVNIHIDGEIGTIRLYGYMSASQVDIIKAQVVFLECSILMHVAAVYSKYLGRASVKEYELRKNEALFKSSLVISFISIPVSFYYKIVTLSVAKVVGYQALYYTDAMAGVSEVVIVINKMFFPCLVGLLIGSAYKKNVMAFVYIVFGLYILIDLSAGDRGGWVYSLAILLWMHHTYYKKFKTSTIVIGFIIGMFLLTIVNAIVSVRNEGITYSNIMNSISNENNNSIVAAVAAMGASMGVNIVAIHDNIRYPYGITYLLALLGGVSTKIPELIGIHYITPTKWLSQEYLGISWGAGYTIITEAICNIGILFAPLIFIIIGWVVKKLLITTSDDLGEKLFAKIVLCTLFMNLARSTTHELVKGMFFGLIPILIICYFFKRYSNRRAD